MIYEVKHLTSRKPTTSMSRRVVVLAALLGVGAFMAVIARLFYMQVINFDFYQQKAVNQQTRDIVVTASRGTIYDRNLKPLAISSAVEMITIAPNQIENDEKRETLIKGLSEILEVDEARVRKLAEKKTGYEIVKRRVEKEDADRVRAFVKENDLAGTVNYEEDTKRYYPYGNFASQVLGFLNYDNQGAYGIEAKYEEELRGVNGRVITAKNAKNTEMPFQYEKFYDAQDGQNVVLTIDEVVQHFLEKHLETAKADNLVANKATGIVMEVKTGAILGMATVSGFDPNEPRTVVDEQALARITAAEGTEAESEVLQNEQMEQWRGRAISEPYEPGSTFKIITTAIALEEEAVNENTTFSCPGYAVVAGQRIRCWKAGGHGSQHLQEAINNSCNPAFISIGQKIGKENFRKYFKAFGLMEKTGIDLPGEATSIYHTDANFNEVELATSSFGQTFKITPLQLITAVSAVANDGKLMKPYIVKETLDDEGNIVSTAKPQVVRQVISETTSDKMCQMLEEAVRIGSGKNANAVGYRVAGKTGTSEKRDLAVQTGRDEKISSFIGFAPADDPQIAVLVLLDEPQGVQKFGGVIAAPVARRIFEDVCPYLGIEPQYTSEELATQDVTVPDVSGKTKAEAVSILNGKKMSYRTVGSGDTVTDQIPKAQSVVPATAEVVLYLGGSAPDKTVTVPTVTGLSFNAAKSRIENLGLYMKVSGNTSGKNVQAISQTNAGESLAVGSVVTVEFNDIDTNLH